MSHMLNNKHRKIYIEKKTHIGGLKNILKGCLVNKNIVTIIFWIVHWVFSEVVYVSVYLLKEETQAPILNTNSKVVLNSWISEKILHGTLLSSYYQINWFSD